MITNEQLKKIADSYTPAFVFDADELKSRVAKIKELLGTAGFVYSIKANPFLIEPLSGCVDALEVCSPGELAICKALGVAAEKIIYSGVNKGLEDIREAVCYSKENNSVKSVRTLTAESIRHYELIRQVVKETGTAVDVILRLSAKNQFGMSKDDLFTIVAKNRDCDRIRISGIHYFAGTQRTKLKHQQEELQMLDEVLANFRKETGIERPVLEYGPGLPYPYFTDDDFSDTLAPLKALSDDLQQIAKVCELSVEMGRFLASSCGIYLTRVADTKSSFDHNWCILDGGINHVNYLGQMMGLKIPKLRLLDQRDGDEMHWTLCGSLCTTNDVLIRDFVAPAFSIGDVIAFENIGAYSVTEGLNLFLSRTMPRILLFENGEANERRAPFETWKLNTGAKE